MKKFSLIIVLIITLSLIAVAESKKIKGGEYFFDNDPGIGNGNRFNLSAVDTLEILDSISTSNLSYGIHTLCLRYLDEDDNWGYTLCNLIHIISKENESVERDYSFPISAYEFFFDDGVAPGNGTLKSITRKDTV